MGVETAIMLAGAAYQAKNANDQKKQAKKMMANIQKPLTWEEAMRQSTQMNDANFDRRLTDTLGAVRNQNINRGFFGQLQGGALEQDAALGVEEARQQAIADTAARLQGNSQAAYSDQMSTALQGQQLANNATNNAIESIMNLPALPTFSKTNQAANNDAMKNFSLPDFGKPITQFPSEMQQENPFEQYYKPKKSKYGFGSTDYTNPFGG